ncbi:hypothetical protein NFI96_033188 [Prochilodus magdalenae]|nr:hypothetical protein NFI96_033188 [Prochilodus magdalenae]
MFTFAAFCYMLSLVLCASLIFFAIWHITAFDELQADFKVPIDQGNPLHAGAFSQQQFVKDFGTLRGYAAFSERLAPLLLHALCIIAFNIYGYFQAAGASRVFHPWTLLYHVPMRPRVANCGLEHPPPFLQHVEFSLK